MSQQPERLQGLIERHGYTMGQRIFHLERNVDFDEAFTRFWGEFWTIRAYTRDRSVARRQMIDAISDAAPIMLERMSLKVDQLQDKLAAWKSSLADPD